MSIRSHTFLYVPILSILYLFCANTNSITNLGLYIVRKMDSDEDSDNPPPTHIRWFHAGHGLAHLDLLATPIPGFPKATSAPVTSWTAFTREESDCCEAGWHALSDEQRAKALVGDPDVPVAAPVINNDDEVRKSIRYPHHRTYFSPIINRRSSYSVFLSGKSAFSRSISERCVYVTLTSLF